jgi:hypothetical protein
MVVVKILALIASIFACAYIIRHRLQLVQTFGKAYFAEKYLGNGGSYSMWIIIGFLIVVLAAFWLFGTPFDPDPNQPQVIPSAQPYRGTY